MHSSSLVVVLRLERLSRCVVHVHWLYQSCSQALMMAERLNGAEKGVYGVEECG